MLLGQLDTRTCVRAVAFPVSSNYTTHMQLYETKKLKQWTFKLTVTHYLLYEKTQSYKRGKYSPGKCVEIKKLYSAQRRTEHYKSTYNTVVLICFAAVAENLLMKCQLFFELYFWPKRCHPYRYISTQVSTAKHSANHRFRI